MSHSHKFFFEHTTPFRISGPGFHFQKFFIYVFEFFALRHSFYYIRNINYPKVLAPWLITHIYSFFILYPFLVLWNFSHSILYVTVLVFCSVISDTNALLKILQWYSIFVSLFSLSLLSPCIIHFIIFSLL